MSETVKGIGLKIAKVMKSITGLEKAGFNEHFKYAFAAEADVLRVVRAAMVDVGLVCLPNVLSVDQNGSRTKVTMQYTLIDTETGESYSASWSGESEDKQDKGISKAITSAGKYFLLKLFLIPTGDDPDADGPVKPKVEAPQIAPERVEAAEYLQGIGMDAKALRDFKDAFREGKWVSAALSGKKAHCKDAKNLYDFLAQAPQAIPA